MTTNSNHTVQTALVADFSTCRSNFYIIGTMPMRHALSLFTAAVLGNLLASGAAQASQPDGEPTAEGGAGASLDANIGTSNNSIDADAGGSGNAPAPQESGFRKWRPKGFLTEIGVYGGIFMLHDQHEFYGGSDNNDFSKWRDFPDIIPEVGLRVGLYPVGAFGIEIEGSALPTKAEANGAAPSANALLWAGRGHLVLQIPAANLVPFVLGGVGAWGVYSPDGTGEDVDLGIHFGGGLKYYVSKYVALRADVRDVILPRRWTEDEMNLHNLEVLLGLTFTFGRKDPVVPPPPPPPPPPDTDADGIIDSEDACPQEAELFNEFEDEDGCPESDKDGDGFWDKPEQDACPDEPGVEPDGCPIRDTDGDGILDPDDQCPQEPEVRNGFQDDDGCPDEVPKEEVDKFSGTIRGILFETGKAVIRPESAPVLDSAASLLQKYPTLKVEVSGHTDSVGRDSTNLALSQSRAESVKAYLVGKGIDPLRITTRGAGESEPIDSNKTKAGRANNRRIEFRITQN